MLFVYNLTLLLHFTNNGFSPFSISESIILYFSSFDFDKYVCCNAAMGISIANDITTAITNVTHDTVRKDWI